MKFFIFFLYVLTIQANPDDYPTYAKLYQDCVAIKEHMLTIHDHRIHPQDAIETSITLFLKRLGTANALRLLKDLQNSDFRMEIE
jgi:hypothetical protein